jgi:hypothetical protein
MDHIYPAGPPLDHAAPRYTRQVGGGGGRERAEVKESRYGAGEFAGKRSLRIRQPKGLCLRPPRRVKDPVGWNRSAFDFTAHKVEESERSSVVKGSAEGREETHNGISPLCANDSSW